MSAAAAAQEFEQAAVERNRLAAVRSLLERQRVAERGGRHARRDRGRARRRGRQRAGLPGARRRALGPPVVLPRQRGASARRRRCSRSSCCSTTSTPPRCRRWSSSRSRSPSSSPTALSARRGARVEVRASERGEKRRILQLAARNAALALEEEQLKSARRRERRAEALDGLREALSLPAVPMRIECFDISNLQGTHTVASMVVFEAGVAEALGLPALPDPHASRAPTTSPRWRRCWAGGWRRGSASRTPRRTSRATTAASRRCRT